MRWTTLADPEGNLFSLAEHPGADQKRSVRDHYSVQTRLELRPGRAIVRLPETPGDDVADHLTGFL